MNISYIVSELLTKFIIHVAFRYVLVVKFISYPSVNVGLQILWKLITLDGHWLEHIGFGILVSFGNYRNILQHIIIFTYKLVDTYTKKVFDGFLILN